MLTKKFEIQTAGHFAAGKQASPFKLEYLQAKYSNLL